MRYPISALAALLVLSVTAACGDSSTNNPFREFQIDDELDGNIYVYDFSESRVEVQYFPDVDLVVGVSRSDDGSLEVGFFGPPLNENTFSIIAAALDSNGNGDFLDEEDIPLTRESVGTFSDTGDELRLDFEIDFGLGLGLIEFLETGDLDDIRDAG